MKWSSRFTLAFISVLIISTISLAGVLPRFASLKSNETNLRTGPSKNYPIKWVIKSKGEPVEIVSEFEQWREIKDKDGDSGWVHESMLNGTRYVVVVRDSSQFLYRNDDSDKKIAKINHGVRARLLKCNENRCYISLEKYKGWIIRDALWGIYKNETFD
jgi:SH3-like domain-containing protein